MRKNVGGIEGLCVIEPAVHGDARGYFMETYNEKDMKEAGIDIHFVQDNQSMSTKGVLRGLHFQKQYPQCKLVRAVRGTVFDVAVDLRSNSETYGKWYGVTLSAENKEAVSHPGRFCARLPGSGVKKQSFATKSTTSGIRTMRAAWLGTTRKSALSGTELKGEYKGSASAEGYELADGTALNLSDKDQKWLGLKDTFKF